MRPWVVSLVTGVLQKRDAISNVCREMVTAIEAFAARERRPIHLRLYTTASDAADSRVAVAQSAASVALDDHFLRSDVVLYLYGIRYPLFDSIHLAPPTARLVVCYFGITHPVFAPAAQRPALYESFEQLANVHRAHRVLSTSGFLTEELVRTGLPRERVRPLFLPVSLRPSREERPPADPAAPLRVAFVGRFVPSKGVHDLLAALARCRFPVVADLVGSRTFSDATYLERLESLVRELNLGESVQFHFDAPGERLAAILREADALVMPSYHEGFCVPVLEAYARGAFVLCSGAGALPETAGGLAHTFPAGDVAALTQALADLEAARPRDAFPADSGEVSRAAWRQRAAEYVAGFSPERFGERFCDLLFEDVPQAAPEVKAALVAAHRRALTGLGTAPPVEEPYLPAERFREWLRAG